MDEQTVPKSLQPLFNCKSADDVANLLRAAGIKGIPGQASVCPVAEYVKQQTNLDTVSVFRRIYAQNDQEFMLERKVKLTLITPRPVMDFILNFDNSFNPQYQDLAMEAK